MGKVIDLVQGNSEDSGIVEEEGVKRPDEDSRTDKGERRMIRCPAPLRERKRRAFKFN